MLVQLHIITVYERQIQDLQGQMKGKDARIDELMMQAMEKQKTTSDR